MMRTGRVRGRALSPRPCTLCLLGSPWVLKALPVVGPLATLLAARRAVVLRVVALQAVLRVVVLRMVVLRVEALLVMMVLLDLRTLLLRVAADLRARPRQDRMAEAMVEATVAVLGALVVLPLRRRMGTVKLLPMRLLRSRMLRCLQARCCSSCKD